MQRQRRNGEPSVFTNFCFDRAHQIITDHKRSAAPRLVMHVITTFVELPNPFPHHSITHGIFTAYFTYLTMNISRFHISCIQTTDNRPYFTVGGALYHLEHFKRTEQHVNTIYFARIGVCGLPKNKGRQCAWAKSRPKRCGRNNYTTFRIRVLRFVFEVMSGITVYRSHFYSSGVKMSRSRWPLNCWGR